MKKADFIIRLVPETEKNFKMVSGYVSDDGEIGYYKYKGNVWAATDIRSGMLICMYKTRKECVAFVAENMERIMTGRSRDAYFNAVNAMREYCLTELGEREES